VAPDALDCRTISSVADFAALADPWDRLVRAMPRPCPYLLHGWLDEWWRRLGRRVEAAVHVAFREGHLVAALPLMVRRRFGVRVALFLGDSGYGVPLADLLLAEGEPAVSAGSLVRYAAAHHDCADLRYVPTESRLGTAAAGRRSLVPRLDAPVCALEAGRDAAGRMPPKTRRQLSRMRRRLAEAGRVDVAIARAGEDLVAAFRDGVRLHALRWRGRFDGSDLADAAGRRFEEAALLRLAAHDVPRIVTLRLDGRPIAYNYYFALGGRMIGHRTAFDPALARFSPGLLNLLDTLAAAAAEGLTTAEFLGGAERFKTVLADRPEPLHQFCGLAAGARGRGYVAWREAAASLRVRLKRSPTLRRMYHTGRDRMRRMAGAVLRPSETAGG
jgi:CelD/BcsL family acetyltransferase involved in cellulose biosynthesis